MFFFFFIAVVVFCLFYMYASKLLNKAMQNNSDKSDLFQGVCVCVIYFSLTFNKEP